MDELTHLSLFSGIGGLDIAAERAGFKTVGQCEWADYPRAVLEKHWHGLPRWRDIRTLTKESFYEQTGLRTVTVLSGGFPCQPFSTAGKRRGKEDDRYLWPEMLRVIQEVRPTWVVGENVAGIVSMELDTVLSDLESIGYACQAFIVPACAVDAPHRRDRCAILAYSGKIRLQAERTEQQAAGTSRSGSFLADTNGEGLERREQFGAHIETGGRKKSQRATSKCCEIISNTDSQGLQIPRYQPGIETPQSKDGTAVHSWWPAEPNVGRVAHGVPSRVDRLKCLGNAVVPQQFFPIFDAIGQIERELLSVEVSV